MLPLVEATCLFWESRTPLGWKCELPRRVRAGVALSRSGNKSGFAMRLQSPRDAARGGRVRSTYSAPTPRVAASLAVADVRLPPRGLSLAR